MKKLAFRGQEASSSPTPHPEATITAPAFENVFILTGTDSRLQVTEAQKYCSFGSRAQETEFSNWALQLWKTSSPFT